MQDLRSTMVSEWLWPKKIDLRSNMSIPFQVKVYFLADMNKAHVQSPRSAVEQDSGDSIFMVIQEKPHPEFKDIPVPWFWEQNQDNHVY